MIPMDFKEAGNFENGKADVTTEDNKAAVIGVREIPTSFLVMPQEEGTNG